MITGILIGVYAVGPSASMTRRSEKRVVHQKTLLISCIYRRGMSSAYSRALPGRECQSVRSRCILPSPDLSTHRCACSHPYRTPSNDVAYTYQSTIRTSPHGILDPQYLAATRPLNPPQLGDSAIRYAWARLGGPAREKVVKREAGCGACRHRAMYWYVPCVVVCA